HPAQTQADRREDPPGDRRSAVADREGDLRRLPRLRRRDRCRPAQRHPVDPRRHHLQGKAERVKPAEFVELLRECYRDKSALRQRHLAAARAVTDYDFNNTYQYVINREEIQLQWLRDAIEDRGGKIDEAPEVDVKAGAGKAAQGAGVKEDAAGAQAVVDKWKPRIEAGGQPRNRSMLRVILGETIEAKRFFDQMVAGRADLLGRSADGARTSGKVLPTRWVGDAR